MKTLDDVLLRLIELIKEDPELKRAILGLIESHTEATLALAEWRKRRK